MIADWAFAAVLASAVLHASWNALARASSEPGDMLATGVMISGMLSLPALLWLGLPAPAAWPWLIGGVIVNAIGIRLAMAAYRRASFGLAYPIMRAGIPLMSLPIGAVLLNEWPRPVGVAGVLLIAAALIMLALAARRAGRAELSGLGYALAAAVAGAGYVAADAGGVRLSGSIFSYVFGVSVGNGIALALMGLAERRDPRRQLAAHWRRGLLISALSTSSFLLYIAAVAVTPVAIASALRETSVLVAVAIAHFVLKEEVGRWHWLAAACAVAGIAAIRLG
jgi:drug/metabolite transporter (DMT)-like permease